jgi:hypothetical protein
MVTTYRNILLHLRRNDRLPFQQPYDSKERQVRYMSMERAKSIEQERHRLYDGNPANLPDGEKRLYLMEIREIGKEVIALLHRLPAEKIRLAKIEYRQEVAKHFPTV